MVGCTKPVIIELKRTGCGFSGFLVIITDTTLILLDVGA